MAAHVGGAWRNTGVVPNDGGPSALASPQPHVDAGNTNDQRESRPPFNSMPLRDGNIGVAGSSACFNANVSSAGQQKSVTKKQFQATLGHDQPNWRYAKPLLS